MFNYRLEINLYLEVYIESVLVLKRNSHIDLDYGIV